MSSPDTSPPDNGHFAHTGGRCLVCEGTGLAAAQGYPGLLACPACGFLTADLKLSPAELRRLYGNDYFHGDEYLDYVREEDSLRRNFRGRLVDIRRFLPETHDKNLFEIGCAHGFFLDEARPHFASVAGIDISDAAVAHAGNVVDVNVVAGDYLQHDQPHGVDVVCLWDVIEHLARPDLVVAKAARDLRPGGLLCVTTGDVGSLNARIRKGRWRLVHPPTHLHYFSVATLSRLLARHGLETVRVRHPGVSRSLRMMVFGVLALGMGRPDLYQKLAGLPIPDMHIRINLFDIMFVIARKP